MGAFTSHVRVYWCALLKAFHTRQRLARGQRKFFASLSTISTRSQTAAR